MSYPTIRTLWLLGPAYPQADVVGGGLVIVDLHGKREILSIPDEHWLTVGFDFQSLENVLVLISAAGPAVLYIVSSEHGQKGEAQASNTPNFLPSCRLCVSRVLLWVSYIEHLTKPSGHGGFSGKQALQQIC
jgi:hypothetical protein